MDMILGIARILHVAQIRDNLCHRGAQERENNTQRVLGILYEEIPTTKPPARMFWSGRGKTWPD